MLGVVHGPAVGVTYAAYGPGTATRRPSGGEPEPIQARAPPPDGLVVIHSRVAREQPPPRRVSRRTTRCASARNAAARSNSA